MLEETLSPSRCAPTSLARRGSRRWAGTGLPRVLAGLAASLGGPDGDGEVEVTAVVTTSDDGGSSGELRRRYGIPAPATSATASSPSPAPRPARVVFSTASRGAPWAATVKTSSCRTGPTPGRLRPGGGRRGRDARRARAGAPGDGGARRARRGARRRARHHGADRVPPRAGAFRAPARGHGRELLAKRSRRFTRPTWSSSGPRPVLGRARRPPRAGDPRGAPRPSAIRVLVVNLFTQAGETDSSTPPIACAPSSDISATSWTSRSAPAAAPGRRRGPYVVEGAEPVRVDRSAIDAAGAVPVITGLSRRPETGRLDPHKLARALPRSRGCVEVSRSMQIATADTLRPPAHASLGARYRVEELQGAGGVRGAAGRSGTPSSRGGPANTPFARHDWTSMARRLRAGRGSPRPRGARPPRTGPPAGCAPGPAGARRHALVAPANDHSCRVEWAIEKDAPGAVAAPGVTCGTGSAGTCSSCATSRAWPDLGALEGRRAAPIAT